MYGVRDCPVPKGLELKACSWVVGHDTRPGIVLRTGLATIPAESGAGAAVHRSAARLLLPAAGVGVDDGLLLAGFD